ncbi:hypothetical protein [Urbifossiella limnaea]|uniref:Uncharacterized protein n=1 Tax=Urbifossiella limnaea TaxID=2528023 RepID=A0A517XLF3_9BACT|nr:hypothetical protein [Urbifossiella limnaea]QDU18296.1 hypothetical protein ETAA1_01810 [Urbifossiella limnaea]
MSNKDAILKAIAGLPDSVDLTAVTKALYQAVARDGTPEDVARFQSAIIPPEAMAEFENPPVGGMQLRDLLAELEARGPNRAAG